MRIPRIGVPTILAVIAGIVGLSVLYVWNPTEVKCIPRCPFLAITGWKCPGCGTLRAIHAILHFRFLDAWRLNPLMILSLPTIGLLLTSRKVRQNRFVSYTILAIVLLWWILRNVI
ncbi:MAG: DUF2752 domain-containing protein [Kiritimatiellae bacterium]|nr:DUF2752 domain-containing protein [Kiritimatiellia bacterium]